MVIINYNQTEISEAHVMAWFKVLAPVQVWDPIPNCDLMVYIEINRSSEFFSLWILLTLTLAEN